MTSCPDSTSPAQSSGQAVCDPYDGLYCGTRKALPTVAEYECIAIPLLNCEEGEYVDCAWAPTGGTTGSEGQTDCTTVDDECPPPDE